MAGEPTLRRGSSGTAVVQLQDELAAAGFDPGPADGVFGGRTDDAVRAFQDANGLAVDGIVGPRTWEALHAAAAGGSGGGGAGGATRGVSIHIGLNSVDPTQYGGWDGALTACEFDAQDMHAIASAQGFEPRLLLTAQATSAAVTEGISSAAGELAEGDCLLVTYSGHGGQVPDTNSDEDEHLDETWVLYDRELVDDELYALWAQFPAGVRIAVLSDSCHSGTVTRFRDYRDRGLVPQGARVRAMPKEVEEKVYAEHQAMYDRLQRSIPRNIREQVAATVLLLSGCQDNQLSLDGERNGQFTGTLRQVWADGAFSGSWREFYQQISNAMPPSQSPNYFRAGRPDESFDRSRPFTL